MWKVMIVDDEQTARLGLERIISETMPELIVTTKAENGMDALEKIEKRQPDIVISDISMPVMDGIELSRQVRKQYPQTVSYTHLPGHSGTRRQNADRCRR